MELLERETYLRDLNRSLHSLPDGGGLLVSATGEAGIGKTSLIETFAERVQERARVLWGACDALFTPRPLGPLYDIADRLKNNLAKQLRLQISRAEIFSTLLKELQEHSVPNILVIEDVHWADEATLDFIKFLGRRISKSNTLFIITYRDNEIIPDHPLRLVLGDIPSKNIVRYQLMPLSEYTVNDFAARQGVKNLYSITGGNPFLVTELLNNTGEKIPPTVKDSVTTRISRLSLQARELVELVSIIPGRAERWLTDKIAGKDYVVFEECIQAGILTVNEETTSFKHELSRMAVEESLSSIRKQELHERVTQTLLQQPVIENVLARIIHHASGAGNKDVLLQYAPLAGEQAATLGAHHQAVAHYARVLEYHESLEKRQYAELLEKYSYECYLTNRGEDAIQARLKALAIWNIIQDTKKIGSNLRWLSRISWFLARKREADEYAVEAIKILEPLVNDDDLAMAYSNRSQLYILEGQPQNAIVWGNKAIAIAESLGNLEILAHALNNVGYAELDLMNITEGENKLLRSLKISLENKFEDHAPRAYVNLACCPTLHKNYGKAKSFFEEGIAYCSERDIDSYKFYMQAWLARIYFETGLWSEADELSQTVLANPNLLTVTKIPALLNIGWLHLRKGIPDAKSFFMEALLLAKKTGELQRIGPVCNLLFEYAWLTGDDSFHEDAEEGFRLALSGYDSWVLGGLAFWKWRDGTLHDIPKNIAVPYAKQMCGDWKGAADFWNTVGCPYEEAMALMDGDKQAQFKALEILRHLDAKPAEEKLLKMMRKKGIRNIPRGPHASTSSNPLGLTNRQIEVLKLLADGLSNTQIANQLFLSPKTIDHHISAILSKLGVHTRTEAAAFAHAKGILRK